MKSLLIILALAIGLCVFGYIDHQKLSTARQDFTDSQEQVALAQQELDLARNSLAQAKNELEQTTLKLTDLDAAKKKEVADLQTKLDESMKQSAETGSEEAKKQLAELEDLRTKMTAADALLAQSQAETAAAKTQAAASQAEVQRLQQLTARPPIGTAMEKKR